MEGRSDPIPSTHAGYGHRGSMADLAGGAELVTISLRGIKKLPR